MTHDDAKNILSCQETRSLLVCALLGARRQPWEAQGGGRGRGGEGTSFPCVSALEAAEGPGAGRTPRRGLHQAASPPPATAPLQGEASARPARLWAVASLRPPGGGGGPRERRGIAGPGPARRGKPLPSRRPLPHSGACARSRRRLSPHAGRRSGGPDAAGARWVRRPPLPRGVPPRAPLAPLSPGWPGQGGPAPAAPPRPARVAMAARRARRRPGAARPLRGAAAISSPREDPAARSGAAASRPARRPAEVSDHSVLSTDKNQTSNTLP